MKLTDEAVEAAWRSWNGMHVGTAHDRLRAAIAAALPHLTDDGAGSGEPAVAADEAGSIPAGNPAPSSPHCTCDPGPEGQHRYWCDTNGPHNCADHRVTALNGEGESLGYTHCGICGEPLSRGSKGATPAIDREALAKALHDAACGCDHYGHMIEIADREAAELALALIAGAS